MSFYCSYRNKNEPSAIYPSFGYSPVQQQVNLRGAKKHHDTIRDMMATSSHMFSSTSSISRGGSQWVYGGRLLVVSARTKKRHHHHPCSLVLRQLCGETDCSEVMRSPGAGRHPIPPVMDSS
jgi:hypothetical protein